jgi:protein tyrosine/serine phosphatase
LRNVPGVENFGVISPDVWRGARPSHEGMLSLQQMGVKTIIDLELRDATSEVPAGVRYVRLPVNSFHCDMVDPTALLKAIAESPKPIFIHCREGRDRTGLAVAIYRCEVEGMSPADAIKELHNFNVHPWWAWSMEAKIRRLRPPPQVAQITDRDIPHADVR